MCGICGVFDLKKENRIDRRVIEKMTHTLFHRGPDDSGYFSMDNIGLGFSRLSIIDLEGGMQPVFNEDRSLVLICNGEIFNYIELRRELKERGHHFKTNTDVEVIVHLYEESGTDFLNRLDGQFGFALYDLKKQQIFCARDHFGVIPFFYTVVDGLFIFASEIKALLVHEAVKKKKAVDTIGLDQVFSFPGLISPRTMFKDIRSLENGHYLVIGGEGNIRDHEYWDLVYPENGTIASFGENHYIPRLQELLIQSVRFRLRADVPVGFYISGGLDSSLITGTAWKCAPESGRHSFGITFDEKEINEAAYQRIMARYAGTSHHEILFLFSDISSRLPHAIYHCECPIKESYNTASLALSEAVRAQNIKVILTGEGSDEFFAGYVGYRFDKIRQMSPRQANPDTPYEDEIRRRLWGDERFFYEKDQYAFSKIKKELYSEGLKENYSNSVDCLNHFVVNKERLQNRDNVQRRSYLDFKLRLVDHLVSDHGDRMAMANSVEARYPFLDRELVDFVKTIPSDLKLKDFEEKYILKKAAAGFIPDEIIKREKFGFVAPGSPYLLKRNIEYIEDILSYDRIKRQGYFNPDTVEKLKHQYMQDGFRINVPFDSDLLIIVLTFGIFLEKFELPVYA